jgi:hypothetical protein
MKLPWTKAIDKLDDTIAKTLLELKKYADNKIEKRYEDTQKNYKLFTRSEQIKHNDHKRRLGVLEEILKDEVAKMHDRNLQRENNAAKDAEGV